MGTIHKNLSQIKKLAGKGKLKQAKKILDDHIREEHHFHSDLIHLQHATHAFEKKMDFLHSNWTKMSKKKAVLNKHIDDIEIQLKKVKFIITKLVRIGKIKLE